MRACVRACARACVPMRVCGTTGRGQLIGARSHAPTPSAMLLLQLPARGEHVTRSRASGELSGPLPRPPRSLIDLSPSLEHTHGFMQLKLSFLRISRVHPVDYRCLCWRTCFPGSFSKGLHLRLSCLRLCVCVCVVCVCACVLGQFVACFFSSCSCA